MPYIGNEPTSVAFLTNTFNGTGSAIAFTLSAAPATTSSILVAVSGVLQDPSTYSVSGTTLTFSAAPPSGTGNISVRFLGIPASGVVTTAYRTQTEFTATAGQTTFSVPSYTVGYIDVYRNGVLLGSADFTATNGTTVVLAAGASAGDLIETVSFYVSSVVNAIPAVAGAVNDTYLNTGAVTQTKLASNVVGNGPAFSAYQGTSQTLTSTVYTKIALNTERFDTNNNFDSTTNYRFTPTVAGYYQINYNFYATTTSTLTSFVGVLYKNGATYEYSSINQINSLQAASGSSLVYMNGTTDYLELYLQLQGTGTLTAGATSGGTNFMSGSLVRAA